jgi:hypothetical protein
VRWRSIAIRSFVALLVTLGLSIGFVFLIDYPEGLVMAWAFSFAVAWVMWVWAPERKTP